MYADGKITWILWALAIIRCFLKLRQRFDVLHIHLLSRQGLFLTRLCMLCGIPVITKIANAFEASELYALSKDRSLTGRLFYRWRKHLATVVGTTNVMVQEIKMDNILSPKVQLIPNGVLLPSADEVETSLQKKYRKDGPIKVVFVGRFVEVKNIETLICAVAEIVAGGDEICCSLLGDGPKRAELEELAARKGLTKVVEFGGYINGEDLTRELLAADVFVLPSFFEGLSNSLLEALAAGVLCIASNIAGNLALLAPNAEHPEKLSKGEYKVVDNGIVFEADDPIGLKKGIYYATEHPDECLRLRINGRGHVKEKYSIESVTDRYENLYCSLLNAPYKVKRDL